MTEPDSRPLLSFLTSAYRTEAYLPGTIASVLRQSCPDWELVVVDNGMDDAIASVVEPHVGDRRISLVRQENRGYRGGVAAAAAVATGKFLSVLDSDDQVTPEYVETVRRAVATHGAVDAVGCDAERFLDGGGLPEASTYFRSIGVRLRAPRDPLTVTDVLSGLVPYYGGAIRREAWETVGGFDPGAAEVEEDVLCWLRLARDFHVVLLPDRLARSRVRDDSASHDPEHIDAFERRLIGTFAEFAGESGRAELGEAVRPTVRRLRYHQALRRARWAFVAGDVPAARGHAREAFAQRRTPRSGIVLVAVTVAPRLLAAAYPAKQRVGALARRVARPRRRAAA